MQKKYDLKIKQKKITPEEAAAAAKTVYRYCKQQGCSSDCAFFHLFNGRCLLYAENEEDLKAVKKAAKMWEEKTSGEAGGKSND